MTARSDRKRQDDSPVPARHAPALGDRVRSEDDHADAEDGADHEGYPEALEDLGHLEPEVGALDLLFRRTPGDVVRERVCEKGLREMDAEAAEEEEAA